MGVPSFLRKEADRLIKSNSTTTKLDVDTPPAAPDLAKAQLHALQYAEQERRLKKGTGRQSQFLTKQGGGSSTTSNVSQFGGKPLIGM